MQKIKGKIISGILSAVMATSTIPSLFPSVSYAVQGSGDGYVDPADSWLSTSSRANEFDTNAVKTVETNYCADCRRDTLFDVFRVPEYASVSAAANGTKYTDGQQGYNGEGKVMPSISDPTPSSTSTYTGYHWSKSVCQNCHNLNTNMGLGDPSIYQNWYILYPCDSGFFHHFTDNEYSSFDEETHTVAKKDGEYCQFCHGTAAKRETAITEDHTYVYTASPEEGHHRFLINAECTECGYNYDRYITAKSVVADYIGEVDGEAHTVEVKDYSESPVVTTIKYGATSDDITLNSAPNFTDEGSHDVWYKITYTAGVANTSSVASYDEIGNAKVILYKKSKNSPSATLSGGDVIITNEDGTSVVVHTHNYEYKYTVEPTADTLGYEIWQCDGCGEIEKRNFVSTTGKHTHNYEYKYTVEPTSTTLGYEVWQCDGCGDTEKRNFVSTTGVHTHNYEYKYTVSPTSTTLGYEVWQCDGCGEMEQKNFVAPTGEDTHNFVYKYTVDPTCTADGYEIWQCANCGSIQRQNYKSKSNHKYVYQSTVPASCTSVGYEIWQCSDCGMTEKRNYTNATGHNYEKTEIREATCAQTGLNLYICKNCGDSYTEVAPINPINHTHIHRVEDPAATCEEGGKVYDRCEECGYSVLVDVTKPLGHSWNTSYVLAPTCTEKGYTVEQCETCKEIRVVNYTDAIGHDWSENGTVVSEATCAADGLKEYTCNHCGDKKYEAISKTGHKPGTPATCTEPQTCTECGAILELPTGHHDYTAVVTPPTCTSMGYTTYTCADKDDTYVADYTDKIEHHYHSVITPATCTALGYTTYTCTECGDTYKSDYVEKKPHDYTAVVTPPTCTSMGYTTYTCNDCGDSYVGDYTDILPHNYTKKVIEPTCTSQGYTIYTCPDCGKEFVGDEKESIEHHYHSEVTAPTCTEMGYTTYTCDDCGYSYVADYTNPLGHDYAELIIPPTCTEMGYSIFTCSRCGDSHVGNEKAKTPHKYNETVTAPTCTEMGYTVFTCADCGETYTGNYTDAKGHSYNEDVTAPTCTSMGYSTFTCTECGDTYKGNYTDKSDHNYEAVVTAPTCTELGYTTFTCTVCGDSYIGNEVAALGHTPSGWIVDTPATINSEGHKHIECLVCGEKLEEEKIDKLTEAGYTNEEGVQTVGNYDVTVTDKNGKPVFDSNIVIDENNNITITLPDGRIITADDKTTVTVRYHESKEAAENVNILVTDNNGNNATGKTNAAGQLTVPNTESNAETNNTVSDDKNTFVVIVTDKYGKVIPNCGIKVGDNYAIDVYLPNGTPMNDNDRITVTVLNEKAKAYEGITVIVIGDDDNIERGITNVNGQVTVPRSNRALTDADGIANVGGYIVKVENEPKSERDNKTPIEGALVTLTEDDKLLVKLPDGRVVMDFDNRTTVTVTTTTGNPVEDMDVNVYSNENEEGMTGKTNTNGQVTVPPWYMDVIPTTAPNATATPKPDFDATAKPDFDDATPTPDVTTEPGATTAPTDEPTTAPTQKPDTTATDAPSTTIPISSASPLPAKPSDYNVTVTDNNGTISGAIVVVDTETGAVRVELPDGKDITPDNRITTTVTSKETGEPIIGIPVTVVDKDGDSASDLTNTEGKAIVPPTNSDLTDVNGNATVIEGENIYHVNVKNELDGNIQNARVSVNEGAFSVELPDGKIIDYDNRTTVTVQNGEYAPVIAANVTVSDKTGANRTEPTDTNGEVIVPPRNEDKTDTNGDGSVINKDKDINVKITDDDGPIDDAVIITAEDGTIDVILPDDKVLDPNKVVTIDVTDKDGKPIADVPVTVTDKDGKTADDKTDKNGIAIVPISNEDYTDGDGHGIVGKPEDDGTNTIYNVVVEDTKGKIDNAHIILTDDGKLKVELPTGKTLTTSNKTTVTVTDKDNVPVKGLSVTISDSSTSKTATTNTNGQVTLPYSSGGGGGGGGGSSRGSSSSSLTYSVTVVDKNGKTVSATKSTTSGGIIVTLPKNYGLDDNNYTITVKDYTGKAAQGMNVTLKDYAGTKSAAGKTDTNGQVKLPAVEHAAYVIGYEEGDFRPDGNMTRAEAAAIFARNIAERKGEKIPTKTSAYSDVTREFWYNNYICYLEKYNLINGYADGTFKPDAQITRSEFVAMCIRFNDLFNSKTAAKSNTFNDIEKGYWATDYINRAAANGWINGYADGSFRPDNKITRAEVVAIVNRATNRKADTSYVNSHAQVNPFTDLKDKSYWAYYDILEAANDHTAVEGTSSETWIALD